MNVLTQIQNSKASRVGQEIGMKLQANGHKAFFAGGCVRDWLLGESPKDIDLTTSATPDEIAALFPKTELAGAHFGVSIVRHEREMLEVATFRSDGSYGDGRRPDSVELITSPEEDVKRRDFTVNGLLANPETGEVVDFVGGIDDLTNRTIRAIGNPLERFEEDHLRMLRAIRFSAAKGFTIAPATLEAICHSAQNITRLAEERITGELHKIFESPNPTLGVEHLDSTGLFQWLFGSPMRPLPHPQVFTPIVGRRLLVWATLFILNPQWADAINIFRLSKNDQEHISQVVDLFSRIDTFEALDIVSMKKLARSQHFQDALAVYLAITKNKNGAKECFETFANYLIGAPPVDSLFPPIWITGNDLIELGLRPGPVFKSILGTIENEQLAGNVRSPAQAKALAEKLVREKT